MSATEQDSALSDRAVGECGSGFEFITFSETLGVCQVHKSENSLVKRGITGVYHNVGKGYLQSYLDEYSFSTIGGIRVI
jgi:hypothetical protein